MTKQLVKVTVLSIGILLVQPLYANAEAIKAEYFLNDNKNAVAELVRDGKSCYLIQAIFSDGNLNSTVEYRRSKLNLLTRFTLLKHLQRKYKGASKFQLSGMQILELGKNEGAYYQVSQIPIANITPSLSKANTSNTLDANVVESSIVKEISESELKVKTNPSAIDAWKNLFNLYFTTGDLDKANSAMDRVMSLKFAQ
ncbi:hypothetical protein [Methylotenera sp.]|uniref:hypothetical protein n=1 Tax=Methylotenera sp. TaxID=2051956 RepID=UPI00271AF3A9|nr:hypothetical protein [Methylotenera sp.]MDO9204650.1 hypothetical protein [Methylotenera sp.]MDP1522892.1 hypothetical protein [Methylotenera sp.]MDP2071507.1 hypothetical protein [Methylotenera sp.]MDP3004970.1 hypothetical protein [Methylotenera sp.]MDP3819591.1 hypothetical protein [Methylotenera sp.]